MPEDCWNGRRERSSIDGCAADDNILGKMSHAEIRHTADIAERIKKKKDKK